MVERKIHSAHRDGASIKIIIHCSKESLNEFFTNSFDYRSIYFYRDTSGSCQGHDCQRAAQIFEQILSARKQATQMDPANA